MAQFMKHVIKNKLSKTFIPLKVNYINLIPSYYFRYLYLIIFVEYSSSSFKLVRMSQQRLIESIWSNSSKV